MIWITTKNRRDNKGKFKWYHLTDYDIEMSSRFRFCTSNVKRIADLDRMINAPIHPDLRKVIPVEYVV